MTLSRMLALLLSPLLLLATACPSCAADRRSVPVDDGMMVLQGWYNSQNGLWKTTGWWNSANALGTVIDYTALTRRDTFRDDILNTFERHRAGYFLNHFYDDDGWWALSWIKAYDLTGEARYLEMAKTIFKDMSGGWDETCGGGIWWNKDRRYKNAIANELFLSVAARLHRRTPGDSGPGSFGDWAQREWDWFRGTGMINSHHLVNDGLDRECRNNGGTTWTYNQGVILAGLAEMYRISHKKGYLREARAIADAAIHTLADRDGILKEPCEGHSDCGGDGPQFKGIFARSLADLNSILRTGVYRRFLRRNAASILKHDRSPEGQLGLRWSGPFDKGDASRQSSAMDALLAARQ